LEHYSEHAFAVQFHCKSKGFFQELKCVFWTSGRLLWSMHFKNAAQLWNQFLLLFHISGTDKLQQT